jgi:tRNA nucleotidyltransferase (CCA-adding enzyme)
MISALPPDLLQILNETQELSRAYLVGGCVRDWLLGIPHTDYDIEVFGLEYEQLARALSQWGKVDLVGRSFGVVKLTTAHRQVYDFSIPRRDSKTAPGHKGFQVAFDPALTPKEAAARRDYTINTLMFDPRERQMLDFFGGESDLKLGILRHASPAFPEDPLRVLRGMQFASRFNLAPAPETVQLARSIKMTYPELAKERVREEWLKWAEKSKTPSLGLRFLADTEWIEHFPELNATRGVPQDPEWHPEGDVFIHTCYCCDAMAQLKAWAGTDSFSRIVLMLAVLTHDFGKATTTHEAEKKGKLRIVSPEHEKAGGPIAESFLNRINVPRPIRERVIPLILNHMAHFHEVTDRAVRRLAKRLEPESIGNLLVLITADSMGRPPRPAVVPASVHAIAAKAEELSVKEKAPDPILLGRHLVEFGFVSGPELGIILRAAYDAQLAGAFFDLPHAFDWLLQQRDLSLPPQVRARLEERASMSDSR